MIGFEEDFESGGGGRGCSCCAPQDSRVHVGVSDGFGKGPQVEVAEEEVGSLPHRCLRYVSDVTAFEKKAVC